jgi:hypothetical protein
MTWPRTSASLDAGEPNRAKESLSVAGMLRQTCRRRLLYNTRTIEIEQIKLSFVEQGLEFR